MRGCGSHFLKHWLLVQLCVYRWRWNPHLLSNQPKQRLQACCFSSFVPSFWISREHIYNFPWRTCRRWPYSQAYNRGLSEQKCLEVIIYCVYKIHWRFMNRSNVDSIVTRQFIFVKRFWLCRTHCKAARLRPWFELPLFVWTAKETGLVRCKVLLCGLAVDSRETGCHRWQKNLMKTLRQKRNS